MVYICSASNEFFDYHWDRALCNVDQKRGISVNTSVGDVVDVCSCKEEEENCVVVGVVARKP